LISAPIDSLLDAFPRLQTAGSVLARLDDILETPIEVSGTDDPGPLRGAIDLHDVTYAHAGGADPVLSDVSLTIRPGEKLALVGPIGAGKSTVARLLAGMLL